MAVARRKENTGSARWWSSVHAANDDGAPDMPRHEAVMGYVRSLEEEQADVHERFLQNGWRYGQTKLMGVDCEWETPFPFDENLVSTNLIREGVDGVVSILCQNRPRITIQTDGADFSTQRKAKWLERYLDAEFMRMGVYDDVTEALRDAAVFGTGVLRVFDEDGRPQVERVLIDEIIVDVKECRAAAPRQLHHRRFIDIDVLCALYPDHEEEIREAAARERRPRWTSYRKLEPHLVPVVESYHLRSGKKAKDGRHSVCMEGFTLLDEEWNEDEFPYVFIFWSKPLTGFYGFGVADEGAAIQERVSQLDWSIALAQDHVARPRMFLKPGDAHLKDEIDNYAAGSTYVTNTGTEYRYSVSQAVGAEIYQHRKQLIAEFFERIGLSQSAAQGKKPDGVESAVAIREVTQIQTGRFAIQALNHEAVFIAIARRVIALQKKLAKASPENDNAAVWKTRNLVKKIPWSSVDLDEDMYAMSVEAASILSRSPAGRMQAVIELGQANLLLDGAAGKAEARRLLGHPDLQRSYDLATAAFEDIERTIELLLEEDEEFPVPEAFQDLNLGLKLVTHAYLKAKADRAPDAVLERLRLWIKKAEDILKLAVQQAAAANQNAAAAAGKPPPGAPMGGDVPGDDSAVPGGLGRAAMMLSPQAMGITPQ